MVLSVKSFGYSFLTNSISYHLWFMYMIIGIYLITPLVKIITTHAAKRELEYFLLLWFVISILSKTANFIVGVGINIELYFVMNYVGYFILGYYLATYDFKKHYRQCIYVATLLSLFATFFLTYYYTSRNDGALNEFWYEYFSPNVFMISVGLFVLFKHSKERQLPKLFQSISTASFGIYLIHMLVLSVFMELIFNKTYELLHPLFSIPVNVFITVTISVAIVMCINRIPILKRIVP